MRQFKFFIGDPVDERTNRMRFYEHFVRMIIRENYTSRYAMHNQVKWLMEDGLEKFVKINNIENWQNTREILNIFYAVHTHNYNNHITFVEYRAIMARQLYNELRDATI